MDFSFENSQNAAPGFPTMAEQQKLGASPRKADIQSVTKRLQSELMSLMMSPTPGISAFPDSDGNMLHWTATLLGPRDTAYANLTFKLSFEFPTNYPYSAPIVTFKTPVYHPNIDFSGRICLDILKENWSAVYNVQTVLLSLQGLLEEPNNNSPLNNEAALLHQNNREEFNRKVLARHQDLED
ncbi:uncharacterized protein Z520_09463 [Fonsecaea multimorphosa CBS 102226]|uniref:Ubiquitin-conjugating enzyme E2 2 n=1 Tax=Fonsecaea multimorphosa CBS 102226 TaxID=1442371 RepID=A0A0D2KDI3_9EURO|nr:uncharacterized protein Z520_09463 [Fonsecaea multimorphosa CBS 102226]KIX94773.1 hypothetical protein Z520_09463 [Fonsecaea multimorphosa CBS 102226]OAL20547.1 hypothetical protein AYO22_08848 [Fonsecaea multimorphosa]